MRARFTLLLVGSLTIGGGCATNPQSGGSGSGPDVLTLEQIRRIDAHDALDVVRRLRPAWLRPRGATRFGGEPVAEPVVYLDNVYIGDPRALAGVRAENLYEIQHLSASDATIRYGTGHTAGAILVTTKH